MVVQNKLSEETREARANSVEARFKQREADAKAFTSRERSLKLLCQNSEPCLDTGLDALRNQPSSYTDEILLEVLQLMCCAEREKSPSRNDHSKPRGRSPNAARRDPSPPRVDRTTACISKISPLDPAENRQVKLPMVVARSASASPCILSTSPSRAQVNNNGPSTRPRDLSSPRPDRKPPSIPQIVIPVPVRIRREKLAARAEARTTSGSPRIRSASPLRTQMKSESAAVTPPKLPSSARLSKTSPAGSFRTFSSISVPNLDSHCQPPKSLRARSASSVRHPPRSRSTDFETEHVKELRTASPLRALFVGALLASEPASEPCRTRSASPLRTRVKSDSAALSPEKASNSARPLSKTSSVFSARTFSTGSLSSQDSKNDGFDSPDFDSGSLSEFWQPEKRLTTEAETEDLKELIRGVYRRKKPNMLKGLDALLDKHRGNERGIYEHVCHKYGERPQ